MRIDRSEIQGLNPVSEIKIQASTLWVDEKEPGGSNWTSSNGKT